MNSLDEKYRTILLLYYGEGFKISEIAQLLDMEEMERILKSNVEIPDPVEQKINNTYRNLGLTDKSRSRRVHKRKKKAWVTIAAAAALRKRST